MEQGEGGGRRKRNLRSRRTRKDTGQFKGSLSPEVACCRNRAKFSPFSAAPSLEVWQCSHPFLCSSFSRRASETRELSVSLSSNPCYLGFSYCGHRVGGLKGPLSSVCQEMGLAPCPWPAWHHNGTLIYMSSQKGRFYCLFL